MVMTTTGNTFSTNGFQKRYLLAVLKVLVLDSWCIDKSFRSFLCGRIFITVYVHHHLSPSRSRVYYPDFFLPHFCGLFWPASFILFMLISSSMCAYTEGGAIAAVLVRPSFDIFFRAVECCLWIFSSQEIVCNRPFVLLAMDIDPEFSKRYVRWQQWPRKSSTTVWCLSYRPPLRVIFPVCIGLCQLIY